MYVCLVISWKLELNRTDGQGFKDLCICLSVFHSCPCMEIPDVTNMISIALASETLLEVLDNGYCIK